MTKKHKYDLILLCTLLVIGSVALFLCSTVFKGTGETVVVTVDGNEVLRVPLTEDREIWIDGYENGRNLLTVQNGEAWISEADCPQKICVKTGKASEIKSIVCAHHRIVVSIEKD